MKNRVITPKNIPIKRHVMTFFNIVASGSDSPTTPIIKAIAVPNGMPLATKTWITGTIPAALAYIGTAQMTASGTANQLSLDIYCSKKPSGTNPCIAAPTPIPINTYSNTPRTIPHASRTMTGNRSVKGVCFSAQTSEFVSDCACS